MPPSTTCGRLPVRGLLWILLAALFVSCQTTPALQSFPPRKIDRTPVTTAGVSSWGTMVVGRKMQNHYGKSTELSPTILPIFYTFHSLDNVLVQGALFPNAMAIEMQHDETSDTALNAGFQFLSEDYIGDVIDGSLGVGRRDHLTRDVVVGATIDIGHLFYLSGGPQTFDFEIGLKPEFQMGDLLWIKPGIAFRAEYQGDFSGTSGNVHYFSKERLDFLFPVTLDTSLSILKNLELVGKYSLDYLGEKDGSFDQKYQVGFMVYF